MSNHNFNNYDANVKAITDGYITFKLRIRRNKSAFGTSDGNNNKIVRLFGIYNAVNTDGVVKSQLGMAKKKVQDQGAANPEE